MFSIGGVSALKQHAFFEFVDWQALERLQVTPPFNFTPDATQRCPGSVPDKSASPTPAQGIDGDNFALQFFDAEFTNQQLSLSMLEDTLQSPMNGGTPMRSGVVSRDEGELFFEFYVRLYMMHLFVYVVCMYVRCIQALKCTQWSTHA